MSEQQNKQLQAGEYYGSVTRRRKLNGLVLSELKHTAPRALPQHSHELGFFSFLLNGDYEEWYGRQTVTHKLMMLMWHPATLQHQDAVGQRGCHFFNLEVSTDWLERLREHSAITCSPFVLPQTEASWLMMRLYREFSAAENGSELAMEGLLLELLAMLARRQLPIEPQKPLWLRRVESRLRDEFTEKPTMTDLATEAGVHPTHLAVTFRRFHRSTISEFIQQLRVEAACERLCQPEISLSEIAMELGFADQSHFSRIFRRLIGMPPKVWREVALNRGELHG
ncbi:MAG: helix-turn-helix transcriptional regulator [Acidobacteria bacterium]|nr:helix-turn-helix transcriptional regulator [Acidobacteriota bacterium]